MEGMVCRLCRKVEPELNDIFIYSINDEQNIVNMDEVIFYTLDIKITQNDSQPTTICEDCVSSCIEYYAFKKKAESSQADLEEDPSDSNLSQKEKTYLEKLLTSLHSSSSSSFELLLEIKKTEHLFQAICNGETLMEIELEPEKLVEEYLDEEEEFVETLTVERLEDIEEDPLIEEESKEKVVEVKAKPIFTCFECGKTFESQSGLNSHVRLYCKRADGERDEEQKLLYTCQNCRIVSSTTAVHFRHVARCKGDNNDREIQPQVLNCPNKDNCSATFEDLRSLRDHANTCCPDSIIAKKRERGKYGTSAKKSRYCQFCNKRFDDELMCDNHMDIHKSFNFLLREEKLHFTSCDICNTMFRNETEMEDHKCKPSEYAECGVCAARYSLKEINVLKQHMFFKHWNEFQCPIESCKADLHSMRFYYFHLQMRHPGFLAVDDIVFRCQYCKGLFENYPILSNHRKKECQEKNFLCSHCDRAFGSLALLNAHIFKIKNPFYCKICQKPCKDSSQLKVHLRSHTKDRPYSCNICQKTFLTASQRAAHADKHNATKKFNCNVCFKSFQTRTNLQSHMKNHTGQMQCPVCENFYSSQKSLECHMRIHKRDA